MKIFCKIDVSNLKLKELEELKEIFQYDFFVEAKEKIFLYLITYERIEEIEALY